MPMAVKFFVFDTPEIEELAGVTVIDCSVAAVTVSVAVGGGRIPPNVAVIFALPSAIPLARPLLVGSLTVATAILSEDQAASKVRF